MITLTMIKAEKMLADAKLIRREGPPDNTWFVDPAGR